MFVVTWKSKEEDYYLVNVKSFPTEKQAKAKISKLLKTVNAYFFFFIRSLNLSTHKIK